MKALRNISLVALIIVFSGIMANAGEPLRNAKITLKSPDGKTYTAMTDASGKFVIRDMDSDGDGFSMEVSSTGGSFSSNSSNKFRVVAASSESSSSREAGTGQSSGKRSVSPRDAASGLPTGKRMHKPFTLTLSLCVVGKEQCDDGNDRCVIQLSSDGENIQGMAINEKGLPGEKVRPKKSTK